MTTAVTTGPPLKRVADFETARTLIQERLVDYLQEHVPGFQATSFRCFAPEHEDSHPSANIIPLSAGTFWKCHGCGRSGDIFTAAHLIEGCPLEGPAFLRENVLYLADRFEIEIPLVDLSEDEIFLIRARRAWQFAARMAVEQEVSPLFEAELERRNWSDKNRRDLGIGQISDYQAFQATLAEQGFDLAFLEQIGLAGKFPAEWQFRSDRMLFTLHDAHGRPIGFTARNLRYEEERDNPSVDKPRKYVNTNNTALFQKRSHIYNLHLAKLDTSLPLYLFEGHPDVITAMVIGKTRNVTAIGGTSFTEHHVVALRQEGIHKVCVCMDGDQAGQDKVEEIVQALSCNPGLDVTVMTMPPGKDDNDPDNFIRNWGIDGWGEARQHARSAFSWTLEKQHREGRLDENSIRHQVDLVANEEDPIRAFRMIRELAQITDYPEEVLHRQLSVQKDKRQAEYQGRISALSMSVSRRLTSNPTDLQMTISEAEQQLDGLQKEYSQNLFDVDRQSRWIRELEERQREMTYDDGLRLGWPLFDSYTFGIPPEDTLIFLGGKANAGKTSMVATLAHRILEHHDDTIVLVYTIDDSREKFIPRMVGSIGDIPIQWVRKPMILDPRYLPNIEPNKKMLPEELFSRRKGAYDKIWGWMNSGRLMIYDSGDSGSTWSFADLWLARVRESFPESRIILLLDNFHNLQDYPGTEPTPRAGLISNAIKNSTAKHRITVISTVEYTKIPDRVKPTNRNLADSRRMEYAADMILHAVNHTHEFRTMPERLKVSWSDPLGWNSTDFFMEQRPVIEVMIGKSKISSFKGSVYFNFNQDNCTFAEATEAQQALYEERSREQPWIQDQR